MVVSRETPFNKTVNAAVNKAVGVALVLASFVVTGCSASGSATGEPTDDPDGWAQLDVNVAGVTLLDDLPNLKPELVKVDVAGESPLLLAGRPPNAIFQRTCGTAAAEMHLDDFESDAAELEGNLELKEAAFYVDNADVDAATEWLSEQLGLPSEPFDAVKNTAKIDGDDFKVYVHGSVPQPPDPDHPHEVLSFTVIQERDETYCENHRPTAAKYGDDLEQGLTDNSLTPSPNWSYSIVNSSPPHEVDFESLAFALDDSNGSSSVEEQLELSDDVDLWISPYQIALVRGAL